MDILNLIFLGYSLFIFGNTIDLQQDQLRNNFNNAVISAPNLPQQLGLNKHDESNISIVVPAISKKMLNKCSDELFSEREVQEQAILAKISTLDIHLIIPLLHSP